MLISILILHVLMSTVISSYSHVYGETCMSMVKPACADECPDTTCVDVWQYHISVYGKSS